MAEGETLYLVKSHSANDGVVAGGSTGDLRTYKVTPGDDTISPNTGVFEFTGAQRGCVPQTSVSLSLHDCAAPKTAEEGLPPIILGDPSTPQVEDHWLHSCDCVSKAWGQLAPATRIHSSTSHRIEKAIFSTSTSQSPSPSWMASSHALCGTC